MRRTIALVVALAGCGDSTSADGPVTLDQSMVHDAGAADSAASARRLVILYTNDEHSHQLAFAPELDDFPAATTAGTGKLHGGVARRAALLTSERAAATGSGAATLTLSAGDNVMGTLLEVSFAQAASDFQLMKALGYDVTCLGNHEFDFGPKALAAALKQAKAGGGLVPTVSTNIHFSATDPGDDDLAAVYSDTPDPTKLVEKYHVLTTTNGIKIGFFGIVGASAAYDETPKAPVTFSLGGSKDEQKTAEVLQAIYADVQPTVDTLRNVEKVDLVVALSHSGVDLDTPSNGEDYQIAQNVSGLDVIISGHTHSKMDAPLTVAGKSGNVIVVQGGAFGQWLGRLDLTLGTDGKLSFDAANSKLLPIDDTIVPVTGPIAQVPLDAIKALEQTPFGGGNASFLEAELTRIEGAPVTHDANNVGSLFFRPEGTAPFDVVGNPNLLPFRETPLLVLTADAILAASDAYSGDVTDVAIEASGVIRGDLPKGKTGTLDFADLFRILPLGRGPDGSIGYPLVHAYLNWWELKAAFEVSASLSSSDVFLVPSGMRVHFDTTRPVLDLSKDPTDPANGRVTLIEELVDHTNPDGTYKVVFDASKAGQSAWMAGGAFAGVAVATNLYIASFAASKGITLKDKNLQAITLAAAVISNPDKSETKDFEAFAAYVRAQSMANSGMLPSRYDATQMPDARRMICAGPMCPK
jgi:5'-nucleotidase